MVPTKILHLVTSPRKQQSVSNQLGNAIIEKISIKYPDSLLKVRDISAGLPQYDELLMSMRYTPEHFYSPSQKELAAFCEELMVELEWADIIVIDSPMHNLGITATLKAYFDLVVVSGRTFRMTTQGSLGLLNNKKAYIAFSSGFIFSEGIYAPMDHNVTYLKDILTFIGLTNVEVYRAEGTAYTGYQALERAINKITID